MNKKDFANFVKEKRKELNMTQEELAEMLSVSRNVVAKWESGLRYPDMETSQLLAEVFQVTPTELYEKSSINDKKKLINPAFIVAPIILLVAIAGFVVFPLFMRDNIIENAKKDDDKLGFEFVDGKVKVTGENYYSDNSEFKIEFKLDDDKIIEMTDLTEKNKVIANFLNFDDSRINELYEPPTYDYEIYYTKGTEKYVIELNIVKKTTRITTPDGVSQVAKCKDGIINQLAEILWDYRAHNWKNDPEIMGLYNKYPYYFNVDMSKPAVLWSWKDSKGQCRYGLISDFETLSSSIKSMMEDMGVVEIIDDNTVIQNPAERYIETSDVLYGKKVFKVRINNGVTAEEMRKILSSYEYRDIGSQGYGYYVMTAYDMNSGYEYNSEYQKDLYNDYLKNILCDPELQ